MLKVVYCIWFVESGSRQAAITARYYSGIIPLKALTKHTDTPVALITS